jgi:hypothetical protein
MRPSFIGGQNAAFGDPDQAVATLDRKMLQINHMNCEFSQYYAEFQVIAADHD